MARINTVEDRQTERTHEGAPAYTVDAEQQLRRSVMACLLWEDEFYESGETIAKRIATLVPQVAPERVAAMAVEARSKMHLRHAPLLLVREMARHQTHRPQVRQTLASVIQRADELAEFLAIYWKDGKQPLAKSVQRGLADAFRKFNAYGLAKYNRDDMVKLRDVLFLSHAKPKPVTQEDFADSTEGERAWEIPAVNRKGYVRGQVYRDRVGQGHVWAQLVDGTLPAPDTWEVALSAGKDKRETFERLIAEQKLGAMALLRNLRKMQEVKVPDPTIAAALREMQPDRVLPFRFLAAVRYGPQFVTELDAALLKNLVGQEKLPGETVVLIDVSGSMDVPLSKKSDMHRIDAAAGLGVLARELCERCHVLTFSDDVVEVPAYRGMALVKAIVDSQAHGGTRLGQAVTAINRKHAYDRLIVITDEQSHDRVPGPKGAGYVINVASNRNGVGYGPWMHIDGWSDRVLDYIRELSATV